MIYADMALDAEHGTAPRVEVETGRLTDEAILVALEPGPVGLRAVAARLGRTVGDIEWRVSRLEREGTVVVAARGIWRT